MLIWFPSSGSKIRISFYLGDFVCLCGSDYDIVKPSSLSHVRAFHVQNYHVNSEMKSQETCRLIYCLTSFLPVQKALLKRRNGKLQLA